jgi:hypothetical protein
VLGTVAFIFIMREIYDNSPERSRDFHEKRRRAGLFAGIREAVRAALGEKTT